MTVIRLTKIGKRYGMRAAIADASLSLDGGEVLGLVGPNGAGKSTVLKIIAGFVRPTDGQGSVLGQAVGRNRRPCPFVGVMLEKPAFIENMSGRANLKALASIRGRIGTAEIDAALQRVGLESRDKRPVKTYSQGMRQRLSLAQAIMELPQIVLLDEPTNGLDPEGIVEMRRFIRKLAAYGAAVILASHLLTEVEAVCDRVIIVSGGRFVRELAPRASTKDRSHVSLVVGSQENVEVLPAIDGLVVLRQVDDLTIEGRCDCRVSELVRRLVHAGIDVERIGPLERSLEDVYLSQIAAERT